MRRYAQCSGQNNNTLVSGQPGDVPGSLHELGSFRVRRANPARARIKEEQNNIEVEFVSVTANTFGSTEL